MEKTFKFIPFFVVLVVLLLSVGYSAFQANGVISDVSVTVRQQSNIRITDISVDSTTSAVVSSMDYNKENTMSDVTFTSTSSEVRYKIEVTNIGNVEKGLLSIDGLPNNLEVVNDENYYAMGTKLCDSTNSSQCSLGSKTYLYVTVKYKNGYGSNTSTNLSANLHFNFKTAYKVYFSNNEIGYALDGTNKSFTLNPAPTTVTVSGTLTSSSYTSPTISLVGVMSDIYISDAGSGGGSGTPDDPFVQGGSVYDYTLVEPGTTIFPNVPGAPKVTAVDDGNGNTIITSFEYTTASETNPVTITSGNPVVTGILALDGGAFTIHIKFRADFAEEDGNSVQINKNKFVVSAFEYGNSKYNGFSLGAMNTTYVRVSTYKDRTRSTSTNLLTPNSYSSIPSSAMTAGVHEFDITLTYNPTGYQGTYGQLNMVSSVDGVQQNTKFIRNTASSTNVPASLTNAIVTLGGNGIDHIDDIGNMQVLEFSVTR